MKRTIVVAVLVWAAAMLIFRGLSGTEESPLAWAPNYQAALATAKKERKPVMVKFYATWCGPCKELEATTLSDAAVVAKSKGLVPVKIDIDTADGGNLFRQMRGEGVPYIVFLDPDGKAMGVIPGLVGKDEFLGVLDKVLAAK